MPGVGALWDADGRRVPGGALAPDPPSSGDDDLSFGDILSVINPLQHIPVVSSIYRWITGDTIKPAARVIGDALFGGPIGLVAGAMNAMMEQVTGNDVATQMLAMVTGEQTPARGTPAAQVAELPQQAAPESPPPDPAATTPAAPKSPKSAELPANATPPAIAPTNTAPAAAPAAAAPAVTRATQGRTLAYYQAHAGLRLAPVDTGRDRPLAQPAAAVHPIAAPAAINAAASAPGDAGARSPEAPPQTWFSAAMLQGLDRYRAMQGAERARPQVDLSQ